MMRLIDADYLKTVSHELIKEDPKAFNGGYSYNGVTVEDIDETPTAFDLEKVLNQIKSRSKYLTKPINEYGFFMNKEVKAVELEDVIWILKGCVVND